MENEIVIWMQRELSFLYWPMRLVSDLGPSTYSSILLAGLYWAWNPRVMARIWILYLGTMCLTCVLKLALHTARPYWIAPGIAGLTKASGFGMPSGHALVTTAIWGQLARVLETRRMSLLCGLVILGVGISRLYLGVHDLLQVVAGMGVGLLVLSSFPMLERRALGVASSLSLGEKLAWLFLGSVGACVLALSVRGGIAAWSVPTDWVALAAEKRPSDGPINPKSLHSSFVSIGTLLGFWMGYVILVHVRRATRPKNWSGRWARLAIGGGFLGPYVFVTRHFLKGDMVVQLSFGPALMLDYLYGVLTGLLASLVVPLVYHRLRW